jgi:hypothetical protein
MFSRMVHVFLAHRQPPSKRSFSETENHERNDNQDHSGSNRFENRIFGLVFVAPLVLIFAMMESALTFSWSPLVLGSVASAGLLALAKVCQGTRLQHFENAWILLNPAIALFVGLVFLGANAVLNGTNPIFRGYMSFPLRYDSISSCPFGPFRFACLSYDPVLILLEYLYWTLVALGLVSAVDLVTRFTARVRNRTV